MNRRHLSFAVSVAELGSFSEAANACSVTQPTLSAGVSRVEDQLGARLFERNTRSVTLTAFGRDIMPAIQDVVASEEALVVQAKTLLEPKNKLVRVGISPIVDMSRTVALMKPFCDRFPKVNFVYKECFVDDLTDRLASGQLDLAIWPKPVTRKSVLASAKFYDDPWIFLPNTALEQSFEQRPCCVSEIAEQSFILTSGFCGLSQATEQMFHRMNLKLNLYPGRAISYSAIEEWADLGLGSALLPASKVSRERLGQSIPILKEDRSPAMLNVFVSWRRDDATSPYLEKLLSFIRGTALRET